MLQMLRRYVVICDRVKPLYLQAQVAQAQAQAASQAMAHQQGQRPPPYSVVPVPANSSLYPSLTEYMGLQITPEMVNAHALVPVSSRQVCTVKWAFVACQLVNNHRHSEQWTSSVLFLHQSLRNSVPQVIISVPLLHCDEIKNVSWC